MGVIFKNNVMYGAGDIEISPICYSEEEREIGCWTDGKPLYQKTFTFSSQLVISAGNWTTSTIDGSTIDSIISVIGYDAKKAFDCFGARVNNNYVGIFCAATIGIDSLTLQYTKTTDTPGSGSWTPGGVPAVHYSEDEHIIGTWIDGSTLYEKTLTYTNQTQRPSDWTTLETFSDINQVIKIDGFIDVSNGQRMSNQYYFRLVFQNNALKYYCAELAAGNGDITVTIQYTKSTS